METCATFVGILIAFHSIRSNIISFILLLEVMADSGQMSAPDLNSLQDFEFQYTKRMSL